MGVRLYFAKRSEHRDQARQSFRIRRADASRASHSPQTATLSTTRSADRLADPRAEAVVPCGESDDAPRTQPPPPATIEPLSPPVETTEHDFLPVPPKRAKCLFQRLPAMPHRRAEATPATPPCPPDALLLECLTFTSTHPTRRHIEPMGKQYIYQIADLTKKHGQREVLKNIWLSFYPGAKIGVLGTQRLGQEHAAADHGRHRHASSTARPRSPTASPSAICRRSRSSIPTRTCWGNVEEAVEPTRAHPPPLRRDQRPARRAHRAPRKWKSCSAEQAKVQDQIEAHNAWELDRQVEIAMDAMNLPPGDADVTTLSGGERRRVALCKILLEQPDLLLLDEPTNHLDAESVAWLERHLAEYPGTVVAVTHDRYFLDNVAGWILELDRGRGIPWEGNYSSWLEQKKDRLAKEEKAASARQKTLDQRAGMDSHGPAGPAGQEQGPHQRLRRNVAPSSIEDREARIRNPDSARQAPGRPGRRGQERLQGLRRQAADRESELPPAARRHRRRHRPQRRGQDDAVPHDHRARKSPTSGEVRIGDTVELGYVDQNRDALDAEQDRLSRKSPAATTRSRWAAAR